MNKIKVIKKIDSLLGPVVVTVIEGLFPPRKRAVENIKSILVIRPGGIGDAVLLVPAIIRLKKAFPHGVIDVLAEKRNSGVFALCPAVSALYRYDDPGEFLKIVRRSYDVVIDTEQWHRLSAIVTRLTRAPMTIGFATNEREGLFTHPVPYSHDDYEVSSFMNLVAPLVSNVTEDQSMPFLTISPEMNAAVRPLVEPLSKYKIVALFPGGSIEERKWGSDRFHQVAIKLCGRGYTIVVVGGNDDVRAGMEIVSGLSNALNLCGKLTLAETAAVLNQSSLLIAGDSGIMHIAYGFGIKVVALFGPGRELKWAPRGKNCRVINERIDCSPCTTFGYTPRCKKNAVCMSTITVEQVMNETISLLKES